LNKKALLLFLLFLPIFQVLVQSQDIKATPAFDTSDFPQWAKDLRRWEIVAFGTFPFTMLFTTTIMDLYRWNNFNGMSYSDRRYAPWPIKSAGAVPMTSSEMTRTIQIAAAASITLAFVDLVIVKVKERKAQRRAESLPVGTTIIIRTPLPEESAKEQEEATEPDADEASS
jgi:hypothetical protein